MERITLTAIENPLQPYDSRVVKHVIHKEGQTVHEIMAENWGPRIKELPTRVQVNDRVLSKEEYEWVCPKPGDCVTFTSEIQGGGGGGGKGGIMQILMAVVIVVAMFFPPAGGWATGTLLMMGAAAAVSLVGGIMSLTASPFSLDMPDLGGSSSSSSDFSQSSTYGWDTKTNPTQEGVAFPVIYGKVRVMPHVIGNYISTNGDNQTLNRLFLVADHPVTSIENIIINDSQISDYTNAVVETRLGSLTQTPISFFNTTYSELGVDVLCTNVYVVRQAPGNNVVTLGVGVIFPYGVAIQGLKGDYKSMNAVVQISYRTVDEQFNKGPWVQFVNAGVTAAQSSAVRRFWEVTVPAGAYEVQVYSYPTYDGASWSPEAGGFNTGDIIVSGGKFYEFIANGPSGSNTANPTSQPGNPHWQEVNENRLMYKCKVDHIRTGISDNFCYPGTSLFGVSIIASDQISGGSPTITADVTRATVSIWDGSSWNDKPATNPAWACWDLLVNDTYGVGVDPARIFYSEFLEWATWCDSRGYTVNIYLDSVMTVASCLRSICKQGRALVVQKGYKYGVVIDKPMEPVMMFGVGNIIENSFNQKYLNLEEITNAIQVSYFDKDLNYTRQTIEVRSTQYDNMDVQPNTTSDTLYGCTSRKEAVMYGRFMMNCAEYHQKVVSFKAHFDSIACTIGDVIIVSHDVPQWGYSGRLLSCTTTQVTLDRKVPVDAGVSYTLLLMDPTSDNLIWKTLVSSEIATDKDTFTFSIPLETALETLSNYSFGTVDQVGKLFRILSISRAGDFTRSITCIEYRPEVYEDDWDPIPEYPSESMLSPIANLQAAEIWVLNKDGSGVSTASLSWRGTALRWNVYWRKSGDPSWILHGTTIQPYYEVTPLDPGNTYEFCISTGSVTAGLSVNLLVLGKLRPPQDVRSFSAYLKDNSIIMNWLHVPDPDLWGYEIRQGMTWDTGTVIVDGEQKNSASWQPPISGTYQLWIKAIDTSENYSVNATGFSITANIQSSLNVVRDIDELTLPTKVPGTKTNTNYVSGETVLRLTNAAQGDGYYDSLPYEVGSVASFSIRQFVEYTANIDPAVATDFTLSGRTDQTYPNDTDQSITSTANADMYYRYSASNATLSGETWLPMTGVVNLTGRYYQLRWVAHPDTSATSFSFTKMRHICDGPNKDYQIFNQSISSSGTTFTYADYGLVFLSGVNIGVGIQGSTAKGFTYVKTGLTSVTIYLYDASGNKVAGTADITFRGF